MPHRNTGAPFERADGTTWEKGEVHEATDRELATLKHKLEPVGEPPEPEEPDPLDGVEFGSEEAEELARESDLSSDDFEDRLGTGEGHAFLVDDVRGIVEEEGDG